MLSLFKKLFAGKPASMPTERLPSVNHDPKPIPGSTTPKAQASNTRTQPSQEVSSMEQLLQVSASKKTQVYSEIKSDEYVIRVSDDYNGSGYMKMEDGSTVANPSLATIMEEDRAKRSLKFASKVIPNTIRCTVVELNEAIADYRAGRRF